MYTGTRVFSSVRGRPFLIYRLDDTDSCYMFSVKQYEGGKEAAVCKTCRKLNRRILGEKEVYSVQVKNGNSFTSDPLKIIHLNGCLPIEYTSVLEKYKVDSTGATGQTGWPVTIHMAVNRPNKPMFVYRLPEDQSMCYRFAVTGTQYPKRWHVRCAACLSNYKYHKSRGDTAVASGVYMYTDGRQLLSDPLVGHNAECRPSKLNDVLKRFPQVTSVVADRIINNEDISQFLPPHGLPFAVSKGAGVGKRFPFHMVQSIRSRCKRISIIYFLPDEPHLCYTFTVGPSSVRGLMIDHTKVLNAWCIGCMSFYARNSSTKSSFDDPSFLHKQLMGTNFLVNPAVGHAEGCKPKSATKIMERYTIVDDFGDYLKSLEKDLGESEQPAGEKLYQTDSDEEGDEEVEGGEGMEGVEEAVEIGETADDERNEQFSMEVEVSQLSSDRGQSTESPEVKLSDEESIEVPVLSTSPAVNKTTSGDDWNSLTDAQSEDSDERSGFEGTEGEEGVEETMEIGETADDERKDQSLVAGQMSSEGSQLTTSDELKDEDVINVYSGPQTVSNATSESCPVEGQLTEMGTSSERKVKSKRKRKFKQSFDPCLFGHDDVIVAQRGSQLEIRFEKQTAPSSVKMRLSYDLALPPDIDLDSMRWKWKEGGNLVVRAEYKQVP